MKVTVFDAEDIMDEIEKLTEGEVVENEGSIKFKLNTRAIKLDVTDCPEIPSIFKFRKHVNSGCIPDKCITEKKATCDGCKFQFFANEVEFKAELLFAQKNEEKRMMATYKIT